MGVSISNIETVLSSLDPIGIYEKMAENVLGTMAFPFCAVPNFTINQKDYILTYCTWENSVVAAASKAAKVIRKYGGFEAHSDDSIMIGQIILSKVANHVRLESIIKQCKQELIHIANQAKPRMSERGGGVIDIQCAYDDKNPFFVVEIHVNVLDAMGANIVDQYAEVLKPVIEKKLVQNDLKKKGQKEDYRILMAILTNYAKKRMARASFKVPIKELQTKGFMGREFVERVVEANQFARSNSMRACTDIKGFMNGASAVCMATGNDVQALEAGVYAHSAEMGSITVSRFHIINGYFEGSAKIPVAVGIKGNITRAHPMVKLALEIMDIHSANELAQVIVCAGLANNIAALGALTTEGIERGHRDCRKELVEYIKSIK